MKMTMLASIVLYKALMKLLLDQEGAERDLPFNVKYKLLRSKNLLEKDVVEYEQKRRAAVEKYNITDDTNPTEATHPEFFKEVRELLVLELEHDFFKIDIADIDCLNINGFSNDEVELFMVLMVDDPSFKEDLETPIANSNSNGEVGDSPTNE